MSILDGVPKSEAEWRQVFALAQPFIERIEANLRLTPQQRQVWTLIKEGVPLGDILGITRQEREAILAHACRLLKKGETKEARSELFRLIQLYPYDARAHYVAAVSLQVDGDMPAAAKMFIQAIAMDATNPEGYLRLGECFLVAREYENAAGAFAAAKDLHQRGYGDAETGHYAGKMLAHAKERVDAAASSAGVIA